MTGRLRLVGQIAAVAVVAALLGLLGWKLTQDESEVTAQLDQGGSPAAPAFTLERLDGKGDLDLASLRGKAVVLNFWASWCGPCKDETPLLQEGWKRWQGKDVVFVGVDVKDFRGDAKDFLARYGVTYAERLRRQGIDGRALRRHRLPGDLLRRRGRQRALPDRRPGRGRRGARRRHRARARPGVRAAALALIALALAAPAGASEERPTAAELESELVCPVCETTLDTSNAPVALRMKAFIRERIAAGDTKSEIKAALVDQFGPAVLAVPPKQRLRADRVAAAARRARARRRRRGPARLALEPRARRRGRAAAEADEPLDPALERRLDDELARFEPVSGTAVLVAFGAGFVSFLAPCVLPLVPGYLSAVSSVEAERLGEPGSSRRVVRASIPFVAGLVAVFVLLGAGAAAVGLSFTKNQFLMEQIAGFVLIVFGFAFMGLLPWPQRLARRRPRPGRAPARLRRSCSAARSRSAPRPASAPCSARSSSSRATPTRSGRARSCSPSTRSGSPSRS